MHDNGESSEDEVGAQVGQVAEELLATELAQVPKVVVRDLCVCMYVYFCVCVRVCVCVTAKRTAL